jgi:hypothetical protein
MCYDQYKQRYELPKACKDKKQDKMNQWKKGYQPAPLWNETKNFPRKYFHSNNQNMQGGGRSFNLGTKKFGDSPKELLKCWECGEPHLRRNYPRLTSTTRTMVHNIQEASIVGDVDISLHRINAIVDG